jgi:hypothetical protein
MDCVHWESYPLANDFGSCQNTSSRNYQRGVLASTDACEYFSPLTVKVRRCEDCHHWYPLDTMPHLGECRNPSSPHNLKPIFWDKVSEDCFKERALEGEEFVWCETCRETIPSSTLGEHRSHKVFLGSSQFPVDEMVEATLAGD